MLALFANRKYSAERMLRPQDVLVACKLLVLGRDSWSYSRLGGSLSLAPSEVHAAVRRCQVSGLLSAGKLTVDKRRLLDACTVGVPTIYYAVRGAVAMGIPTATHAACLEGLFPEREAGAICKVWPCEGGPDGVAGESLLPLYPTVPRAVRHDERLHEILALVDVVRVSDLTDRRGREDHKIACDLLKKAILHGEGVR